MNIPSVIKIASPMAFLKPVIKNFVARLGARPVGTLFNTGLNAAWIGGSGKSFLKAPKLNKAVKQIKKI